MTHGKKTLTRPCYYDYSQQMLHTLTTTKNPKFELQFRMFFITIAAVPMLLKTVTVRATKSWIIFVTGERNLVVSVKILGCWFHLSLIQILKITMITVSHLPHLKLGHNADL